MIGRHEVGAWYAFDTSFAMPQFHDSLPLNCKASEPGAVSPSIVPGLAGVCHAGTSPSYSTESGSDDTDMDSTSEDMDFPDLSSTDDFDPPYSPLRRTLSELYDDDDLGAPPAPFSPSRRSFAELPEDATMGEPPPPDPETPLLAGLPLLTLPGAEPDNSLIVADNVAPEWSSVRSPPRGSGLGLFLPIQAASSSQSEAPDAPAIEPNLNFSPEAVARVNASEFEKLKSVRRRTWVSERKAKEDEIYHAKQAEALAGQLSVAPPVPSKLADFDERGGVSAGADADSMDSEPAQSVQSHEKSIRAQLLRTEWYRAEARRVRKREKERGRELQALLCLKLGEDPDAAERAGATAKPGKTAIVSMPQLTARIIMKRREAQRPFKPRKRGAPYTPSPLSLLEPEPELELEPMPGLELELKLPVGGDVEMAE
ncbi:hypothetical protein BC834DRAFT_426501 [Gloeopeniophorella convolvens]|nr:hypothetical protein BC834DRAFT_426501 [Gloeopeniophorella convolvens]